MWPQQREFGTVYLHILFADGWLEMCSLQIFEYLSKKFAFTWVFPPVKLKHPSWYCEKKQSLKKGQGGGKRWFRSVTGNIQCWEHCCTWVQEGKGEDFVVENKGVEEVENGLQPDQPLLRADLAEGSGWACRVVRGSGYDGEMWSSCTPLTGCVVTGLGCHSLLTLEVSLLLSVVAEKNAWISKTMGSCGNP